MESPFEGLFGFGARKRPNEGWRVSAMYCNYGTEGSISTLPQLTRLINLIFHEVLGLHIRLEVSFGVEHSLTEVLVCPWKLFLLVLFFFVTSCKS